VHTHKKTGKPATNFITTIRNWFHYLLWFALSCLSVEVAGTSSSHLQT